MSKEKIICWRGSDGDVQPVKCVCDDKFGYPNYCKDENGKEEKMFGNTHFIKKEDASILNNNLSKEIKIFFSENARKFMPLVYL